MALVVGTHYRDQIFDGSLGPGSIHYMHIKRSSNSNRTAGTMEVICTGELGGSQQGNGLAYFKSCWNSWNYQTDGSHSIKIVDNIRESDTATGTSIFVGPIPGFTYSGTTDYSFTSSELIYPIYTGWYGFLEINLEWTNDPDLQYQLDNTSTAVF
jgi:hypothetical protein